MEMASEGIIIIIISGHDKKRKRIRRAK